MHPAGVYSAARTTDLIRESLVPVTQATPLRALREQARLLSDGHGHPLGVALIEKNDGFFGGPNNCLFASLQDILVPDSSQLRNMMIDFYCDMDGDLKPPMACAILADMPVAIFDAPYKGLPFTSVSKRVLTQSNAPNCYHL